MFKYLFKYQIYVQNQLLIMFTFYRPCYTIDDQRKLLSETIQSIYLLILTKFVLK